MSWLEVFSEADFSHLPNGTAVIEIADRPGCFGLVQTHNGVAIGIVVLSVAEIPNYIAILEEAYERLGVPGAGEGDQHLFREVDLASSVETVVGSNGGSTSRGFH